MVRASDRVHSLDCMHSHNSKGWSPLRSLCARFLPLRPGRPGRVSESAGPFWCVGTLSEILVLFRFPAHYLRQRYT